MSICQEALQKTRVAIGRCPDTNFTVVELPPFDQIPWDETLRVTWIRLDGPWPLIVRRGLGKPDEFAWGRACIAFLENLGALND